MAFEFKPKNDDKNKLLQLESLEAELQDVAINEITYAVRLAEVMVMSDKEQRQELASVKQNAASTVALMSQLARYSGLKRGTLSREAVGSSGNYPQDAVDAAKRAINAAITRHAGH